jgi:DNA polymerase-1
VVKYLLVDGNNLAMRSVHAGYGAPLSSGNTPTAALMIFANSLCKIIAEERPTHVGVAWDGKSKYRLGLLPTYKANRKSRLAPDVDTGQEKDDAFLLMWAFLDAARIPSYRHPDYEADDLIATWWADIMDGWVHQYRVVDGIPRGETEIMIASGDKDFLQMAGPNPQGVPTVIRRFGPAGDKPDIWDAQRVLDELGFEPRCWPLVTALTGDVSDNVIGVPQIGPKRAVKLLARHDWDLDAALEEIPEHRELVLRNLLLVDLREVPLAKLNLPEALNLPLYATEQGADLAKFFATYQLAGLAAKYERGQLWSVPTMPGRSLGVQKGGLPQP